MRAWLALVAGMALVGAAPRLPREQIRTAQVSAAVKEATAVKAFMNTHPKARAFSEVCRAEAKQAYLRAYAPARSVYDDLERFNTSADLADALQARAEYMSGYRVRCMADAIR